VKANAMVCVNCGFDLARGQALQTEVATDEDEAWEEQVGKPRESKKGKGQSEGSGSLTEEVQGEEQPEEVSEFKARQKREQARRALAEEQAYEQFKRQEYVYPPLCLLAGLALQFLYYLAIGDVSVSSMVGVGVMIGFQLMIIVPLLLLTLFIATRLGMAFGNLWTAIVKLAAVALLPLAVSNLLMSMCAIPLPLVGLIAWLGIMYVTTWLMLVPFFDLEQNEGFQLAAAIVAVEVIGGAVVVLGLAGIVAAMFA
jgi:hypothetical protein